MATSSKLMFASLLQLKQANPVLSKRLVQLFKLSFGKACLEQNYDIQPAHPTLEMRHSHQAVVQHATKRPAIEKVAAVGEESKTCRNTHPNPSSLTINFTRVKSNRLANHEQRTSEEGGANQGGSYPAKITPRNIELLTDFISFVGKCPYQLDSVLESLLESSLEIVFKAGVTGFSNNEMVRVNLLTRFSNGLGKIIANCNLQESAHEIILDSLSSADSVFLRSIEAKLGHPTDSSAAEATSLLRTDAELGAICTLCRHLPVIKKKQLCRMASDALFNPTSKAAADSQLNQDEHPDPQMRQQRGLKNLLNSSPDSSQTVLLLKLFTSLLQSPLSGRKCGSGENFDQDKAYFVGEEHLLEDKVLTRLRNMCLSKFQQLFSGRVRSEHEFQIFLDPYCTLLFQLIFVKDVKEDSRQKSMFKRINHGLGLDTMRESEEDELSALEILTLVIRKSFNKAQPDLTIERLRQFLQLLLQVCHDQALCQRNEESSSTEAISELMDTLACFCTQINMMRVNQDMYDSIHFESSGESDRGSLTSEERTTVGSSLQETSSLRTFFINMQGKPLFEEALAQLVRLELDLIGGKAEDVATTRRHHNHMLFEQSATCHFISKLVCVCQSTTSQNENLPKLVSFTASLIRQVVTAGGRNATAFVLQPAPLAKIKGQVQILMSRVFQCILRQSDSDPDGVLGFARNILQLAFVDLQRVTNMSETFSLFLTEFHELFQRRSIIKVFADVSTMVFNTLARCEIDKLTEIEDVKTTVDQRVRFMRVFVDILEAITLEEPKLFSIDLTAQMLEAIVKCMSICQDGGPTVEKAYANREVTDELKSLFLHLWIYVAQQDPESPRLESVLGALAQLTPANCFSEEFIHLNLRAAAQQNHLDQFCGRALQAFQSEIDSQGNRISLKNSILLEQSHTEASPSMATSKSKSAKKKAPAKKKSKDQDEEEFDERDELEGNSANLSFNEKVYLAIFILVQTHRVRATETTVTSLPFVQDFSLIDSTMTAFKREKALITNDFSKEKSLGEQTVLYKTLSTVARTLFVMHLQVLRKRKSRGLWDAQDNHALAADFNYLVQATCSGNGLIRDLASTLLTKVESSFPQLVLLPGVLDGLLDVTSAVHLHLNQKYDGRGHVLRTILSESETTLPTKDEPKVEALAQVLKLLQKMLLNGVILGQHSLMTAFESFQTKYQQALTKLNRGETVAFGVTYLTQLISQIDLNKVDLGKTIANFNLLRALATSDPSKFSETVQQVLLPQAYNKDSKLAGGLKDLSKLLERASKDSVLSIKPFQIAPLEAKSSSAVLLAATPDLPSELTLKEAESKAGALVDQVISKLLEVDQIKAIEHLSGFNDRKRIEHLIKLQLQQQKLMQIQEEANDHRSTLHSQGLQSATLEEHQLRTAAQGHDRNDLQSIREQAKVLAKQDPKERLQHQMTILLTALEDLIVFTVALPSNNFEAKFKSLQTHLVFLATCFPTLAHTKETARIYSTLVAAITTRSDLLAVFVDSLPFAIHLLTSKLSGGKAGSTKSTQVQGIFEVSDRVKQSLKAHQKFKQQTSAEEETTYDFVKAASKSNMLGTDFFKCHSLAGMIEETRYMVETLGTLFDTVFEEQCLTNLLESNPREFKTPLTNSFTKLIDCLAGQMTNLLSEPKLCKVVLKALKNGFSLRQTLSNSSFNQSLAHLTICTLRSMHRFNFRRSEHSQLMEELQLIEDVKFLLAQNKDVFIDVMYEHVSRAFIDTTKSTSAHRSTNQRVLKTKIVKSSDVDVAVVAQICGTAIQQIKLSLVANNCQDLLELGEIDPLPLYLTQQQSESFASTFPKLALTLSTKHSAQFKFLLKPTLAEIERDPNRFMRCKEALHMFLDQKLQRFANSTLMAQKFAFWRLGHILHLLKFIALKHEKSEVASTFALKPLYYAEPKTVIFYLPQLFQALRTDKTNRILQFLLKRSQQSASIAHNVLWLCKVESILEQGNGRKVTLPCPETLPDITQQLYKAVLAEKNLKQSQRSFFETETNFFEKITSISGLLQPSQSKDEKKAIIREKLIEYNQEVPECVYLPTNQTCRVVGIVTNSGQPMQSAARVPILISFEVEDYPGPDNDPILQENTLISSVISQTTLNQREGIIGDLTWTNASNQRLREIADPLTDRLGADLDCSDVQEKTQCEKLGDYQMNIKNVNKSLQSLSNILDTEEKAPAFSHAALMLQNTQSEAGGVTGFHEAAAPRRPDDRTERSKFLRELQAQFKDQGVTTMASAATASGGPQNAFSVVANMLTNMQQDASSANNRNRKISGNVKNTKTSNVLVNQKSHQLPKRPTKVISCIFKVNDDLRQDILALQVIKLFQKIFKKCDLDLYVVPYKCISNRTGDERLLGGIIECIPNSYSRDQLGKAFEIDLHKYFLKRYGSETSKGFQEARLNFTKSLAAYCVVSYILQIKDRHNGNIMIDENGHLIHIDFGFIFDWSPGRDMRFESANFKLTQEFIDILGGDPQAEAFKFFISKVQQGFLAVREHAAEIQNLVELMWYSGYPCFKPASLDNLNMRFMKDFNDFQAARFMNVCVEDARDKWTTRIYDFIQSKQNKIFF